VTYFRLAQYLLPLRNLSSDVLIDRFKQLEKGVGRLMAHRKCRRALGAPHGTLLAESNVTASGAEREPIRVIHRAAIDVDTL
jgi:hypothetical protein